MSKRALDEGEIAETTEGENPEEDTVPAKRGKTDEDEVAPAAADESAHTAAEEQPAAPVDTAAAEQPAAASASAASAPDAASLAATTASAATAVSASAAPPAAAPSVPPPYGFATGDAAGQAGNLDPNAEAHPGMMGLKDADLAVMLTQRMEAKAQRNFAVADAIRKQLEAYGIRINDARANSGGSGMWTASDGRRCADAILAHACSALARARALLSDHHPSSSNAQNSLSRVPLCLVSLRAQWQPRWPRFLLPAYWPPGRSRLHPRRAAAAARSPRSATAGARRRDHLECRPHPKASGSRGGQGAS